MPAVMVTWSSYLPRTPRNRRFCFSGGRYYAYSRRDGQAELAWMVWL